MICFLEDDDNIRKFVCYALAKEGYEVKGFSRPSGFYAGIDGNVPELILLDIMLPEEDGLSVLQKLKKSDRYENVPVIIITAKSSEFDTVTGLDTGADDYITKPFGMTELMSRVRAVLRRYEKTKASAPEEYRAGGLYVNNAKHIVEVCGKAVSLSYKEYMLLLALLEADGRVVTREALFSKIWGEYYGESRTLDVHIRKLRSKLGSAGDMIHTVKNVGYRLDNDVRDKPEEKTHE